MMPRVLPGFVAVVLVFLFVCFVKVSLGLGGRIPATRIFQRRSYLKACVRTQCEDEVQASPRAKFKALQPTYDPWQSPFPRDLFLCLLSGNEDPSASCPQKVLPGCQQPTKPQVVSTWDTEVHSSMF